MPSTPDKHKHPPWLRSSTAGLQPRKGHRILATIQTYSEKTRSFLPARILYEVPLIHSASIRQRFHIESLHRGGTVCIYPHVISPELSQKVNQQLLSCSYFRTYQLRGTAEPRSHFLLHSDATDNFEQAQPGYKYLSVRMKARPLSSLPYVDQLSQEVGKLFHVDKWTIGVNPVLYRDGVDKMGAHADDDQGEELIVSAVVHSPPTIRPIRVSIPKQHKLQEGDERIVLFMAPGDIYSMDGEMQRHYVHSAPPDPPSRAAPDPVPSPSKKIVTPTKPVSNPSVPIVSPVDSLSRLPIQKHESPDRGDLAQNQSPTILLPPPIRSNIKVTMMDSLAAIGTNIATGGSLENLKEVVTKTTETTPSEKHSQQAFMIMDRTDLLLHSENHRLAIIFRVGEQKWMTEDSGNDCHSLCPDRARKEIVFGRIPGILEGDVYTRSELLDSRAHRMAQRGVSGNCEGGCDAIIVSGGGRRGPKDVDQWKLLVYSAPVRHGGRALRTSFQRKKPIRVFRSYLYKAPYLAIRDGKWSPDNKIYRYDGLYSLIKFEETKNEQELYVFHLLRSEQDNIIPTRQYMDFCLERGTLLPEATRCFLSWWDIHQGQLEGMALDRDAMYGRLELGSCRIDFLTSNAERITHAFLRGGLSQAMVLFEKFLRKKRGRKDESSPPRSDSQHPRCI